MKKLVATVAVLLIGFSASLNADSYPVGRDKGQTHLNYDVPADGYTYGGFGDANSAVAPVHLNGLTGFWQRGTAKNIKVTATASTTLAAVTAGTNPFVGIAVGDKLRLSYSVQSGTEIGQLLETEVLVTAKASEDSVTVSETLTLPTTGVTFRYHKFRGGTAATDGFFSVEGFDAFTVHLIVTTINATSLDAILECKVNKFSVATQHQALTNFTAAGGAFIEVNNRLRNYELCRVGWGFNTDTGVQSVSAYVSGVR